jgi:hypothetical protein
VAVVAAAAELLCLAGESADGVILLNSNDKENLTTICKFKGDSSRARFSVAVKAVSVTGLADFNALRQYPGRPLETASGLAFASLPRLGLIGRCERTGR